MTMRGQTFHRLNHILIRQGPWHCDPSLTVANRMLRKDLILDAVDSKGLKMKHGPCGVFFFRSKTHKCFSNYRVGSDNITKV